MLKKPFDVISRNTKGTITEGLMYTVLRISIRKDGTYYQVIGDKGKKVRHNAKNFLRVEDLEERGM